MKHWLNCLWLVNVTGLAMAGPSGPRGIPEGMVYIPGGGSTVVLLGLVQNQSPCSDQVDAFFMDATEVTNAQFFKFVDETGYLQLLTKARPQRLSGADPKLLFRVQSSLHLPISKLKSGVPGTSNGGAGNPAPTGNIQKVPEAISMGWILILWST